jgi:membrane protein YdbS with pleckstrin-like domain
MAEKRRKKGRIRRILRIAIPVVMVGFGVVTVVVGGWKAIIALIPILAVHVAVALVVIPLWVRYRRRRGETVWGDGE